MLKLIMQNNINNYHYHFLIKHPNAHIYGENVVLV